jgi:HlyD family secretion protein
MKKLLPIVIVLALGGTAAAVYYKTRPEKEPTITTLQVSRGDIIDGVGATGTLQAVRTVTVGTQVSGIVQELYADFNSIVKKGQIVARLDPSILETQVETAAANLTNANANLERQRVTLADAQQKLTRARELNARQLTTKVDLENAELAVKQAEAQMKSTQSSIVQAAAAVNKARVDLNHTVITAPIDGIIIKRSVDRGQTVAASMSAPELFIIASDLTQMQVNASIDESDVGRMRPGQAVSFRVDAYPNETFHGSVKEVRLNPVTVQNVVTYATVIDVPNPELKLKPGMTAQVTIEIARRENVLRIPNAALRFRPTKEIFEALNQTMPPELERGFGRGNRGGQQNAQGPTGPTGPPAAGAPPAGAPAGTATAGQAKAAIQQNQQRATPPAAGADNGSGQAREGRPRGESSATPGGGQSARPSTLREPQGRPEPGRGATGSGQAAGGEGGRTPSAEGGRGGGGQGGRGGFGNMTPEERQKRMEERMASMSPEERAAFQERMKQRQAEGGRSAGSGQGGRGGGGRGQGMGGNRDGQGPQNAQGGQNAAGGAGRREGGAGPRSAQGGSPRGQLQGQQASNNPKSVALTSATTIDALFAPLVFVETRGRAWLHVDKQLKLVELRLGITDGTFTEVINADALQPGQEVVTAVITPEMASRPAGTQQNNPNNPLMPQRGRGPGGPGGGGGGGGRGGGGRG